MWYGRYIENIIKMFLPPTAQIIVLENPYKRPAVARIDLDGDGIFELVGGYYWQGENYIIVLKYDCNTWQVADRVKGKGYDITYFGVAPIKRASINNLVVGWKVASIWSNLSVYEWKDKALKDLIDKDRYYSMIEVKDMESTLRRQDGKYELSLWIHDTGDAYKVKIYRWSDYDNNFILALDVYPYYFKKVVNYYKNLLKEKDSTTYWYYLSDAQMKTGMIEEALRSIDRALSYPYPYKEELIQLRKEIEGN
ncbi:hypothetical protein [Crassaminicella profunda]|uniref:hypothetical protein n=1 Tax=Crassaminicella profunda TaxID=1286698 RepID=UPI001CA65DE8|nr:hypothetical protein [Crassaminicella profunda]QZY56850.1 hypothetical protein K7H06_08000 [Crassaminicella profunda]